MKIKKQKGGNENIINVSVDLIKSMIGLGESIFTEIHSITHMSQDINNAASTTPNQINGPPPFNQPNLSV